MAIGDPPSDTVYTAHPDGSISSQNGYLTNSTQVITDPGNPVYVQGYDGRYNPDYSYGQLYSSPSVDDVELPDTRNWWQRNAHWLVPAVGAVASIGTGGWLPALIGGAFGLWQNYQQNKYNQENYEIQKKDALEAEKRANEEYDRRQADARQYNDSWADRLRSQGFNPLAAISKGGGVTASTASAPSTTSMPLRQARRSGIGSIGSSISGVLSMLSTAQSIKQQQATTANIEAQTALTRTQNAKESQLVESFWERFSSEMRLLGANLRNQSAVADINESLARVRVATEQDDINKVKYETLSLYYNMKAAEYAPQIANQQLANLALEYAINNYRKRIVANDASASDMSLADITAHYESRAVNNVADREVVAAIRTAEAAAGKLAKENAFLPVDKVFGYLDQIFRHATTHITTTTKLVDAVVPF